MPAAFENDAGLVTASRNGRVETLHRGTFAVAAPDGELYLAAGDAGQKTYVRSSAKPFQAMALILTGAADALNLSDQDIAIACSSHSGEPEHVERVTALLATRGLDASFLQCGIHAPTSGTAAVALYRSGDAPSALHNNCSGKHAGMLVTCSFMGWSLDDYMAPEHPLQRLNLRSVSAYTGISEPEIGIGVDGCGVPVFYIPVLAVAVAFARLATGREVSSDYAAAGERIRRAMTAHPFLVAGTGRFDTQMMTAGAGALISKGGAMGGQGIGVTPPPTARETDPLLIGGFGFGLKMTDGASAPIGTIAFHVLKQLGALASVQSIGLIEQYERPTIKNHAGTQVGNLDLAFSIESPARV